MASTVLLVDDSDDDVLVFSRQLAAVGVANPMVVVADGNAAIKYLMGEPPFHSRQEHPFPGALVLDLSLPGRDGFEILKWIRAHPDFKDLPVFVVSGLDDLRTIRRAYEAGATSFLAKPCRVADVENLVHGFPKYWIRS